MKKLIQIMLSVLSLATGELISGQFSCITHIWLHDKICLRADYNKLKLPTTFVHLDLGLEKVALVSVDSEQEIMTLSLGIRTRWHEPALIVDTNTNVNQSSLTNVDLVVEEKIWTPDLWVEKLLNFEKVKSLNPMTAILIDTQTKTVEISSATLATIRCSMTFDSFPFDEQV